VSHPLALRLPHRLQQADLILLKSVSNAHPNVGDEITFTVTLTNTGRQRPTARK
jgi:hypothetical protein